MRRSPVAAGVVVGLVVGVAAAAAIASTGGDERPKPKVVIAGAGAPAVPLPGGGPMVGEETKVQGPLPALRGEARGYRLRAEPRAGAIERLAAALGVHGPVQADSGGWFVREGNRLVRVQRTGGLPWFLSTLAGQCTVVPDNAPGAAPGEALPPVPSSGPAPCPQQQQPAPDLPGQEDALASAMETLGRAGLGVSRPTIADQATSWRIEASPLIGDRPTFGFAWTVTVGAKGAVEAASGFLAQPEAADTYPLVGTARGLERLKASRPVGTVTGVRQGLMLGHVGAEPYLVPAYLFELEGRPPAIAPVPAIEDRWIQQPAPTVVPGRGVPAPG
jgi:hypothetical protein